MLVADVLIHYLSNIIPYVCYTAATFFTYPWPTQYVAKTGNPPQFSASTRRRFTSLDYVFVYSWAHWGLSQNQHDALRLSWVCCLAVRSIATKWGRTKTIVIVIQPQTSSNWITYITYIINKSPSKYCYVVIEIKTVSLA